MVEVYTTSSCPWCRVVKNHLSSKGIEYVEKNVQENKEYLKELQTLVGNGRIGVPITNINGNLIRGGNVPAIDEALSGVIN